MMVTGGGGLRECLFPSDGDALDANESLSGKVLLFHFYLVKAADTEETISVGYKHTPR
jgi:hypothetical protein